MKILASLIAAAALSFTLVPLAHADVPMPLQDGVYKVGVDVSPGTYWTNGVDGLNGTCAWSRLKHNDGATGDIIQIQLQKGAQYLTVKPTDGYLSLSWGCVWIKK